MLVKNIIYFTVFVTQRGFDGLERKLRPRSLKSAPKIISQDAYYNLQNYLKDTADHPVDQEGNTTLHQATRYEEVGLLETHATQNPHMLFLLNNEGNTPLDTAIMQGDTQKAEILIT